MFAIRSHHPILPPYIYGSQRLQVYKGIQGPSIAVRTRDMGSSKLQRPVSAAADRFGRLCGAWMYLRSYSSWMMCFVDDVRFATQLDMQPGVPDCSSQSNNFQSSCGPIPAPSVCNLILPQGREDVRIVVAEGYGPEGRRDDNCKLLGLGRHSATLRHCIDITQVSPNPWTVLICRAVTEM